MDQAVLITFRLSDAAFGAPWEREILAELASDVADVVEEAGVGEFDGTEVGDGEYVLFLYGHDADALFETVEPLVSCQPWDGDVFAIKRYGPPGAKEVRVVF